MKITAIRATPVNIALEAPYLWSYGSLAGFSKTIVEVETSDGLVGLGEGPSPANASVIINNFAPRLIGMDAIDIQACEARCLPSWRGVYTDVDFASIRAFGAIEMALWDIRGKAWGRPLCDLFGGRVRDAITFTDYFSFREEKDGVGGESDPQAVLDYCLGQRERFGTTMFEGKLSTADPRPSIETLELLRERLGADAVLRIDSNKAYSLGAATRIAQAIEPLGIRSWEDPVATFEDMAKLRRHTSIPFSVHTPDLRRALALGVPDAFCTDVNVHGGIGRTLKFIAACEQVGLDFWCYSGDSGIASSVYLHLAAAHHHIREPSQSLFHMQPFDVIEEGPLRPRDNVVAVPQGPGIGVTLSRDRLAFCHRDFVDNGPYDKFHDPDRPGIFRRLPLS
ncbi:mandelate racemase/muconate lactonizing enzyme family protein [Bosea sp. PAMC 26642]|uniref:mandelate racemase/muconate lactonizing enzyme family protein n=1 Tax=Bosea sp. (strain PAMC 26642) TaxID=1792307 RepID=UPI0007704B97|nr:mandelate racemase/muconate lactonizing enzyme family protein [Bosea sp. PAMC 26642]AMJ61731.1 chloromuconate cycloisomerase [Bosea sp. PAMC 26642]